ncbi:MAG: hypothetical protein ABR548_12800 [Actinomycetota bacterium]|nr:hypothetical protein [Actinomycetota bacterium]
MIRFFAHTLPLALEGTPKGLGGVVFVVWWVLMLMGSMYVLLMSIYGAKVAYLMQMAAIFAFLIIYSAIWLFGAPGTVPGTGPRGREPAWVPFTPTSQQAADFTAVKTFPNNWEKPGKKYAGGIDSAGEVQGLKDTWGTALATRAQSQGLTTGTKATDYEFRTSTTALTPDEEALPVATVRFTVSGSHLIAGATIPATSAHPEVTVFAYRDKGQIFYFAAIILGFSILLFALHLYLLTLVEKKQSQLQGAPA